LGHLLGHRSENPGRALSCDRFEHLSSLNEPTDIDEGMAVPRVSVAGSVQRTPRFLSLRKTRGHPAGIE
ncbi:MAG: hypothetical protein ABI662_06825, partial [Dermatophilaceae bacterium]